MKQAHTFMHVLHSHTNKHIRSGILFKRLIITPVGLLCIPFLCIYRLQSVLFLSDILGKSKCLPISTGDKITDKYSHFPAAACGTNA